MTIQHHLSKTIQIIDQLYSMQHGNVAVTKDTLTQMINENQENIEALRDTIDKHKQKMQQNDTFSEFHDLYAVVLQNERESTSLMIHSPIWNRWMHYTTHHVEFMDEHVVDNICQYGKYMDYYPTCCVYAKRNDPIDFSAIHDTLKQQVQVNERMLTTQHNAELDEKVNIIMASLKSLNSALKTAHQTCKASKTYRPPENIYEVYSTYKDPFTSSISAFSYILGQSHWEYIDFESELRKILQQIDVNELQDMLRQVAMNMNNVMEPPIDNINTCMTMHQHYVEITTYILQVIIHLQNNIFCSAFEVGYDAFRLNNALMNTISEDANEDTCMFLLDRCPFIESLMILASISYMTCITEFIKSSNIRLAKESFDHFKVHHLPIVKQLSATSQSLFYRQTKKVFFSSLSRIQYRTFEKVDADHLSKMVTFMLTIGKTMNSITTAIPKQHELTFDEDDLFELTKQQLDAKNLSDYCRSVSIDTMFDDISKRLQDIRKQMILTISDLYSSSLSRLSTSAFDTTTNYSIWASHNFEAPPNRFL
eukprot:CAMPEP_0117420218 /NCGR_PEP_ID=MMETSP0758-20121206/1596_1 /TAXON_ID=63605 /ORGANISM="Percolomonas cosmopolitus, Strain AE-1 (ATCC 50343)" /LENGTH=536 /DNA_ID=CAMNT_0005201695 /DNA_START=1021 /DNA_END=2631 /DNA_ORIENTATION=-